MMRVEGLGFLGLFKSKRKNEEKKKKKEKKRKNQLEHTSNVSRYVMKWHHQTQCWG
jgi:hypothetical protein